MSIRNSVIILAGLSFGALAIYAIYNSQKSNTTNNSTGTTTLGLPPAYNPNSNSASESTSTITVENPNSSSGYSTVNINNAADTGNTNVLTSNSNSTGTAYTSSSVEAAPNTLIGYTPNPINPSQAYPTWSYGSSWQGAGEYISVSGAPEYIGSQEEFNQQVSAGFLG